MNGETRIALIRAVNVGGRSLKMDALRSMVAGLGYREIRSLMQSGNLVFRGGPADASAAERQLETATAEHFNIQTDYLVQSGAEWRAMIAANPFPAEAKADPSHMVAMPLKEVIAEGAVANLRAVIKGREQVEVVDRTAYLVYPDGIGESKLTIKIIERWLGAKGTGRNWNTVLKLAAMLEG